MDNQPGAAPADPPRPVEAPAHGGPGTAVSPAQRRRLLTLLVVLTVVVAASDQVSKYLAESRLREGEVVPVLGDVLGLQLVHNPGAAFSFATGMTWVFTVVSVVVVAVIVRTSRRLGSRGWATALGLLLGGSLGNLADRLFRDPGFGTGHVVDFINYNGWFVGNVADIAIVAAAILVAVLALMGREVDGTRAPERSAAAEAPRSPDGGPDA